MTIQADVVIVGGGLSGLSCAVALARRGRQVALITSGTSLTEQFSGSIGALGAIDGKDVTGDIAKAAKNLQKEHPYRRIGVDKARAAAAKARELLAYIGMKFTGDSKRNHWRLSPLGIAVPAWLSLEGYATLDNPAAWQGKRIALMTVPGYLDQARHLVSHNLEALGAIVTSHEFKLQQLQSTTPTPRPTTLSRKLDGRTSLTSLANDINDAGAEADLVLMPAVMGDDEAAIAALTRRVTVPLRLMPTLPPTTSGNLLSSTLQHYLMMFGGYLETGQTITGATTDGDRMTSLTTTSGLTATAREYVFATGHLAGGGLQATPDNGVIEPITGLDVIQPHPHTPEEFATTGIATDGNLRPTRNGQRLTNVSVIGNLLGGHDAATMHDGEGVDLSTALYVAQKL